MWAFRVCALILTAAALLAQRTYTPAEIDAGSQLFQANCSSCHGPDGDAVPGVDLGHGKFKRPSSDDELNKIIRNGIPGTSMPPSNFQEAQAATIVAFIRSMAAGATAGNASVAGDASRGRVLFEGKGACLTCHRVKGNGSRLGPDLSDIGNLRRAIALEQSILDPDAEVLPANRFLRVVTKAGATVTGRILNQDTFSLQLIDAQGQLRSFSKADLRWFSFIVTSQMPSYQGKLSPQEVADLVSYLVSLKGVEKQ